MADATPDTPLTADVSILDADAANRRYLLEFDMEHGRVQAFGQGDVWCARSGDGTFFLESGETGGCYSEPQTIAGVELWTAEAHHLAVFPSELSMRAGGLQIARHWGDQLPAGIYRVLTATTSTAAVPGTSAAPRDRDQGQDAPGIEP